MRFVDSASVMVEVKVVEVASAFAVKNIFQTEGQMAVTAVTVAASFFEVKKDLIH